jgi:hypothetical protein
MAGHVLTTQMQLDAFLKEHEVYDFTAADFEQDRETPCQLRKRDAQHSNDSRIVVVADISPTISFLRAHSAESRRSG